MENEKKFEYVWTRNVSVLVGKKLYDCRLNHTQFTYGEFDYVNVTILADGKTKNVKFSDIYQDADEFKNGKSIETHFLTNPNSIGCNGKSYPFNPNTMTAKYWVMDEEGPVEKEVKVNAFIITTWGEIQTDCIPQGTYTSKSNIIRFMGITKVDENGKEKNLGGVGKALEFTDEQGKAITALKNALMECKNANVSLLLDTNDSTIYAVRNDVGIELENEWYDATPIHGMRPDECHEVGSITPSYDGDILLITEQCAE